MIEIALRFGWLAQSIVLVSTVILVIYIITSENWNTQSNTHHRETPNEAIKRYILDFNSKKELDGYFQFPIMVLNNGKKIIQYNNDACIYCYLDFWIIHGALYWF